MNTIYLIYWIDSYGKMDYITAVDNPKKWLKMNNKERVDNGEEPENLSDFHIDEIDVEIFNKENLWKDL